MAKKHGGVVGRRGAGGGWFGLGSLSAQEEWREKVSAALRPPLLLFGVRWIDGCVSFTICAAEALEQSLGRGRCLFVC